MIDKTTANYTLSQNEIVALDWLDSHGYSGKLVSQTITKSVVNISKDDLSGDIEIPTLGTLVVNDLIRRLTKAIDALRGDDEGYL